MRTVFLDIETEGLNPYSCDIVTAQVMVGGKVHIFQGEDIQALKGLLESSLVVGHNLKFEQKFLKHHYGIELKQIFDTWLAEIIISGGLLAGKRGTSLKAVAKKYCSVDMSKKEQTTFRRDNPLTPEQVKYAALDVEVLPGIYKQQQAEIERLHLSETMNIEMNAVTGVAWLELSGLSIDLDRLNTLREKTQKKKSEACQELLKALKSGNKENQLTLSGDRVFNINLNSTVQLQKALNNIGIKCQSTAEAELKKFNHPIIDLVLEYREAEKLLNTFIEKQEGYIDPVTGRIHADFNQYGAHSGRFTCRKPNLQQQPNNEEWRGIYRAEAGNQVVTADYSQIELRILAQVSGDQAFIEAYNNGQDLHTLTASKIFKKSLTEVTKKERSVAKSVNFGTVYGIGAHGLKRNLKTAGIEVSEEEAKQFIRSFYRGYPGVKKYLQKAQKQGLRENQIRNVAGRLHRFNPPEDERQEGYIKRQCQNMPIQSLCADMVKISLASLYKTLEPEGVMFINTVHDELVFECPQDKASHVAETVKSEMEKAGKQFLNEIPVIVETTVSEAWTK